MNYRKYRNAAKTIFTLTFLFALIAAGVYCTLAYFDFTKEIPFEWEYLAALGGVVAVAIFLAFWLFCISCSVKKREEKQNEPEEQIMDACAEYAVEPEYIYIQQPPYMPERNFSMSANFGTGKKKTDGASVKLPPEKLKKVALIAIPTAAVTAGVAVAIAAKARKKRKVKQLLRDLERLLGCRK